MKKIYLVAALTTILFSCRNDNDDAENITASIISKWKISKTEMVSGKDNSVFYSENAVGCDAENYLEFKNGGDFKSVEYYKSGNNCVVDYEDSGLYNYDQTAQTISIQLSNSSYSYIYKVEKLTNDELVISNPSYDYDGDDIDDKEVYHLYK